MRPLSVLRFIPLLAGVVLLGQPRSAAAFVHVVHSGDTLAAVAERYYGKIQHERILVAANCLDAYGGTPIVAGSRLEIPTLGYRRVAAGETWEQLAEQLLGARDRAVTLALANDVSPWLKPEEGAQVMVPYNLRVVAGPGDSLIRIAQRFYGDQKRAWILDKYNLRDGKALGPGDVVLVPLSELTLTEEGKRAALAWQGIAQQEGDSSRRVAQEQVRDELPTLVAHVKGARYVDAVRLGSMLLALGAATRQMQSVIHRQLLEAYVALDATGLASAACAEWRKVDTTARLDPVYVSPKILAACNGAMPG